ncbi:MAG: OmpA family protein [Sedimentisphaerales bacterium]|nr:OmpA family protein [Sedimentisphaerales bacterium]
MFAATLRQVGVLAGILGISLLAGCTNYRHRYEYLNVEHENLKARYQKAEQEKEQLTQRVAQDQQTIEELTRQLEAMKRDPSKAGFGNLPVSVDTGAGTITVTVSDSLLFDPGRATLKSATIKELDQVISTLKQKYSGKKIIVIGHTDSDPIQKTKDLWKDNWELSTERALAVTRYLIEHGIPEADLMAAGCGPARPVAPNTTAAGKAKNRRVEIVVQYRG